MKIVLLVLLIFFALDIIFGDGGLLLFFFSQEMYLPFIVKIIFIAIAIIASVMLFHAIVWDFNLLPKLKNKKTEYEIEQDIEAENTRIQKEREEIEEKERLEKEENEKIKREMSELLEKKKNDYI